MPGDHYLPTLTLRQPYASLTMLRAPGTDWPIKWIETRGWKAPEKLIGRYIGIHAAARLDRGAIQSMEDQGLPVALLATLDDSSRYDIAIRDDSIESRFDPGSWTSANTSVQPLPLGVLVGSALLDACVPMTTHADIGDPECIVVHVDGTIDHCIPSWHADQPTKPTHVIRLDEPDIPDGAHLIRDVSDQAPYGLFVVGRFAWLLSDAKPTTERCPWCMGHRSDPEAEGDRYYGHVEPGSIPPCPVCRGDGTCAPIPAKGRQRLWRWTPERAT